jgi:lipoyl(octanoyl) transferase
MIHIRNIGTVDYQQTLDAMRRFTAERSANTADEIWLLQHSPVFTQGMNGKAEHLLDPGDIPLVQTDRGGQVTYHGPGQLIVYLLLDLRRRHLGVKQLVELLEQSVIELLKGYGIQAERRSDAPGVYVNGDKIAALGLRIRRNGSYHGLSLNIDVDLEPFERINPCGYRGMGVTRLADLGVSDPVTVIGERLSGLLLDALNKLEAVSNIS